jgi:hypothetical protein
MAATIISNAVPKNLEWWGLGREAQPGILVGPSMTIPLTSGAPNDQASMLVDKALRGDMGEDYNEVLGTEIGQFSLTGNVYLDSIGYVLHNVFGDYQTAFQVAGAAAGPSTVAGTVGQTTLTGTAFTAALAIGTLIQITSAGGVSEVVVLSSISSATTYTFANTPLRANHAVGAVCTSAAAGAVVQHTFALLNGGAGAFGYSTTAQPATHTITHNNALAVSTGPNGFPSDAGFLGQRRYGYWCSDGVDFTMNLNNLFQHATKGTSFLGVDHTTSDSPATAFSNSQSDAGAEANWRFQVAIGGTIASGGANLVPNVEQSGISIGRQVTPKYVLANQQNPAEIVRMGLQSTGRLTYIAQDESPLLQYLTGNTMILEIGMSANATAIGTNGWQGILFHYSRAIFEAAQLSDPDVMAYDVGFRALMNTTDIGVSGARGPLVVTLVNQVPTY